MCFAWTGGAPVVVDQVQWMFQVALPSFPGKSQVTNQDIAGLPFLKAGKKVLERLK